MGTSQSKQQREIENLSIDIFHGHEYQKKTSLPLTPAPELGWNTFTIDTTNLAELTKAVRTETTSKMRKKYPRDWKEIMRIVEKHGRGYPVSLSTPAITLRGRFPPLLLSALTFAGVGIAGYCSYVKVASHIKIAEEKMERETTLAREEMERETTLARDKMEREFALAEKKMEREFALAKDRAQSKIAPTKFRLRLPWLTQT